MTSPAPLKSFAALLDHRLRMAKLDLPLATGEGAAVELAMVYPIALRDGGSPQLEEALRHIAAASAGQLHDAFGHCRPVYQPLLQYAVAQTVRLLGQSLSSPIRTSTLKWLQASGLARGANVRWTAAEGSSAARSAWTVLAAYTVADLSDDEQGTVEASRFFDCMVLAQQPSGAWLSSTGADNIETLGYDELVLLHAIGSFAAFSARDFSTPIAASAAFHSRQLQPDHATTQPWALHALAAMPGTRPLAEQLLHAATSQQPDGLTGVPVVLLADALYGLRSIGFVPASD